MNNGWFSREAKPHIHTITDLEKELITKVWLTFDGPNENIHLFEDGEFLEHRELNEEEQSQKDLFKSIVEQIIQIEQMSDST